MKMVTLITLVVIALVVCGCASDLHFDPAEYDLRTSIVIPLNVKEVSVINKTPIYKKRYGFASDIENPLPERVQNGFGSSVLQTLQSCFIACGSNNKAIIHLNDAVVTKTKTGVMDAPFIGLAILAMGHKEEYKAKIKGTIEIENISSQVLSKADFQVEIATKEKTGTIEEIQKGIDIVAVEALRKLPITIDNQTNRYLYKYIARGEPIGIRSNSD